MSSIDWTASRVCCFCMRQQQSCPRLFDSISISRDERMLYVEYTRISNEEKHISKTKYLLFPSVYLVLLFRLLLCDRTSEWVEKKRRARARDFIGFIPHAACARHPLIRNEMNYKRMKSTLTHSNADTSKHRTAIQAMLRNEFNLLLFLIRLRHRCLPHIWSECRHNRSSQIYMSMHSVEL